MKLKKTEHGVEFTAETAYEKECLEHLANQSQISVSFEDRWNRTGSLKIEGKPHPWDEKK